MVSLITNTPEFFGDISEEIRLFMDERKIDRPEEPPREGVLVRHSFSLEEGAFVNRAALVMDGAEKAAYTFRSPAVSEGDALLYKRQKKRGAKISVYRALLAHYKQEKPWGSLTGIRPTKLYRDSAAELGEEGAKRLFLETFNVAEGKLALAKAVCDNQKTILESAGEQDLDLYVGIPFCTSRCAYCSFYSAETSKDGSMEKAYVDTLLKEINLLAPVMEAFPLRSVYVGGGTPTALSEELLRRVLLALKPYVWGEFTVEAGRPDTITDKKLALLKEAGVSRISINPQTTCQKTLERIGRKHGVAQFFAAAELAKKYHFDSVNMDLIAGLPGEGEAEFLRSVKDVLALAPENITVHSLAIKRASKFGMEQASQFLEAERVERMLERAAALILARYRPYYLYRQKYMAGNMENTGYSFPGKECVYNVDIMEETVSILALGAGAASKRVFEKGRRIERYRGVKDLSNYLLRVEELADKKARLFRPVDFKND